MNCVVLRAGLIGINWDAETLTWHNTSRPYIAYETMATGMAKDNQALFITLNLVLSNMIKMLLLLASLC